MARDDATGKRASVGLRAVRWKGSGHEDVGIGRMEYGA
jgi:hypothetical protein